MSYEQNKLLELNADSKDQLKKVLPVMIGNNKQVLLFGDLDNVLKNLLEIQNCTITRSDPNSFSNEQKFDVILLCNALEDLNLVDDFFKNLKNLLLPNGYFVCLFTNIFYAPVRLDYVNGNHLHESLPNFSLNSMLIFFDNLNLKISQLNRIAQKFTMSDYSYDSQYSKILLDLILQDPESDTIQYVVKAETGCVINPEIRKYIITNFPKNIVSQKLEQHIEYYENVLKEKEERLQKTLAEKEERLQKTLAEKEEHYQRFIDQIRNDYKAQMNEIKSSKIWKILDKLNKNTNQ